MVVFGIKAKFMNLVSILGLIAGFVMVSLDEPALRAIVLAHAVKPTLASPCEVTCQSAGCTAEIELRS